MIGVLLITISVQCIILGWGIGRLGTDLKEIKQELQVERKS